MLASTDTKLNRSRLAANLQAVRLLPQALWKPAARITTTALWNSRILGTTFMENGEEIAHAISEGHSSIHEADTEALYRRKVAERA